MPVESIGTATTTYKYLYLPVSGKFVVALSVSILWAWMAVWMAQRWIMDLSALTGMLLAQLIIWGIAVIPGFMNAFLVASLLMDRRPPFAPQVLNQQLPPITILVAAYNEAGRIQK
jgi:biofilm PGA synthesis N-glycosyltransferase PgaC